jgi:hypothetical protein
MVGAAATRGYAEHRWPSKKTIYWQVDDNNRRMAATILWPLYWALVWPFTRVKEITSFNIKRHLAVQAELEAAKMEVEKEIGNL